jgi:uncharacterized membrane protein
MSIQLALVVAIILAALVAGIAVAHVVQWPTRRDPPALPVERVQRVVSRYGAVLGLVEALALVALIVALVRLPAGSTEMWLVAAAAVCVAGMMGVWAAWLRPLNATITAWQPEAPPADWVEHHARWSTLHRVRVVLAILALALLLMGPMARSLH